MSHWQLQQLLPPSGTALEIASGTGQHVEWFAQHLPLWTWQPSDAHPGALYRAAAEFGLSVGSRRLFASAFSI